LKKGALVPSSTIVDDIAAILYLLKNFILKMPYNCLENLPGL